MAGRKLLKEGLEAVSQFALPAAKKIRAYHGTPHTFAPEPDAPLGRFKDEAIGTGEGAQVYGRGHYFAESDDVGRNYRSALSGDNGMKIGGKDIYSVYRGIEDNAAKLPVASGEYDKLAMLEDLMQHGDLLAMNNLIEHGSYSHSPEAVDWFQKEVAPNFNRSGSLYEVNINADPERFLDWDKPLNAQSADFLNLTSRLPNAPEGSQLDSLLWEGSDTLKGDAFWRAAEQALGGSDEAKDALKQAGIPGIKYFDAGSRVPQPQEVNNLRKTLAKWEERLSQSPDDTYVKNEVEAIRKDLADVEARFTAPQTRNYVVFDPSIIEIIKKYGIAGALGAGLISPDDAKAAEQQGLGSPQDASEGPEATFSTPKADRLPAASPVAARQDRVPVQNSDWVPGKRGTPPNPFPTDEELWSNFVPNALSHLRNVGESVGGIGGDVSFTIPGTDVKLPLSANVLPNSEDVGKYTDEQVAKLRPDLAKTINDYTRNPSQDPGSQLFGEGIEWGVDPLDLLGGVGVAAKARKLF